MLLQVRYINHTFFVSLFLSCLFLSLAFRVARPFHVCSLKARWSNGPGCESEQLLQSYMLFNSVLDSVLWKGVFGCPWLS